MTDNQLWIVVSLLTNLSALFMMYNTIRLIIDRYAPKAHEKDL